MAPSGNQRELLESHGQNAPPNSVFKFSAVTFRKDGKMLEFDQNYFATNHIKSNIDITQDFSYTDLQLHDPLKSSFCDAK